MLSAPGGPVAVQASPGHTTDPNTVPGRVVKLQERFGFEPVVLVGDRGLLTQVQIEYLKRHRGLGWARSVRRRTLPKARVGDSMPDNRSNGVRSGVESLEWT